MRWAHPLHAGVYKDGPMPWSGNLYFSAGMGPPAICGYLSFLAPTRSGKKWLTRLPISLGCSWWTLTVAAKKYPHLGALREFPPHITCCVTKRLLFPSDLVTIGLTSNWPNITYATYPITGSLSNFWNIWFLIPEHENKMFDPKIIPRTTIFHNNLQKAANVAKYLNSLFPETMQHTWFVKHYHSKMSANYLECTFQDFSLVDGTMRILCVTSGASTVDRKSVV